MLLSEELGIAELLQPEMSWDNNDRNCPVLPQPQQSHMPRPPGQELCEARGSNKGIIHGMGQGRCQMLCSVTGPTQNGFCKQTPALEKGQKTAKMSRATKVTLSVE